MSNSFQLTLAGQLADDQLITVLTVIEIEEGMDIPSALHITLPVTRSDTGDLAFVADPRFQPMTPITLVASASGGAPGAATGAAGDVASALGGSATPGAAQCLFDGYVLSQRVHLERGITQSEITVWAQDASWLMSQTETTREWADVTDDAVAAAILDDYGITPADANGQNDSVSHTSDSHSLMQRGTDLAFLRMLARRSGKVFHIACADKPGQRIGWFAAPSLEGDPQVTITLNDPANWTVSTLDLEWDATRPSAVTARSALFGDASADGVSGDTSDSGLKPLGPTGLAAFATKPTTVMLTAAVDSAGDLVQRAQGLLREAGWFARCEGEAHADRLGVVLRPGMLAKLTGLGALYSGVWLVWNVRHKLTRDVHVMKFTLLSNGLGTASTGGAAGLASAAAAW